MAKTSPASPRCRLPGHRRSRLMGVITACAAIMRNTSRRQVRAKREMNIVSARRDLEQRHHDLLVAKREFLQAKAKVHRAVMDAAIEASHIWGIGTPNGNYYTRSERDARLVWKAACEQTHALGGDKMLEESGFEGPHLVKAGEIEVEDVGADDITSIGGSDVLLLTKVVEQLHVQYGKANKYAVFMEVDAACKARDEVRALLPDATCTVTHTLLCTFHESVIELFVTKDDAWQRDAIVAWAQEKVKMRQ